MKLLTGYALADLTISKSSLHREVAAGEVIFSEGAPAVGLFIVLNGRIEIVKNLAQGEVRLNQVGPNGVFGEMGLIGEGAVRSATARALEPSLLLEVKNNPIQILKEMGEVDAAIVFLKKVICVLGEWLRTQDANGKPNGIYREDPDTLAAAEVVKDHLPRRFLRGPKQIILPDGEFLCRQGEKPDGFYFIHSGSLEILKSDPSGTQERKVSYMHSPTVAGELGYFSGEPRLASLRAAGKVTYTHFSGAEFEGMEEKHPNDALEVLLAAARSIVILVRKSD